MTQEDLTWRLADEAPERDAVSVALARGQATLLYGPLCFEFLQDRHGPCVTRLRLTEVGRVIVSKGGVRVVQLFRDGYEAERLLPHPGAAGSGNARVQGDLGRGGGREGRILFEEVARAMDDRRRQLRLHHG